MQNGKSLPLANAHRVKREHRHLITGRGEAGQNLRDSARRPLAL
jgi:hypothetical protein